jgi:hypothetical protein
VSAPLPDDPGTTQDPAVDPDDDGTAAARRPAVLSGAVGVVALAAALVTYLVAGPPYGQVVAGAVLYLLGLLAALISSVLLWMVWGAPENRLSPRRPAGTATAALALLLTCACVVVSLGRAGSAAVQLVLMGATALALAAAVGTLRTPR